MREPARPLISVQVRELVEFALRGGDLGGHGQFFGPSRAMAGTRGHQQIQRSRPAGYQKEVRVSCDLASETFILRIQGRIDGVLTLGSEVLLEEIKTVQRHWDGTPDPLHWAQVKCYGRIYAQEHGHQQLDLRLVYLNLDTGKTTEFLEHCSLAELCVFFERATGIYLTWLEETQCWRQTRDQSIQLLEFPFPQYRPGQRELAITAYRAMARGERLFLEAPTGIGKTISVLFPAVKAIREGKVKRIFYLTARTTAQAVAEKALADLRRAGLRLRTLTLTAKEKLCVQEGQPCDPQACPLARGYYDRSKEAMRAALAHEEITRPLVASVAQQHQVCPFELSLDLSSWVDAVICDYNYALDPEVYLRRHFGEENGDYVFLVDEAHNLADRARDMFSAGLDGQQLDQMQRAVQEAAPKCAKALRKLHSALRKLRELRRSPPATIDDHGGSGELGLFPSENDALSGRDSGSCPGEQPRSIVHASGAQTLHALPPELALRLEEAIEAMEHWLARNDPAEFRAGLMDLFFRVAGFLRTAKRWGDHYRVIVAPGRPVRVRLFCLDPSPLLAQALTRTQAAIFFSATLTPLDYYRQLLGGSAHDRLLQLPSPFPPENLAVLVQDRIRTQFKDRAGTLGSVVDAIGALIRGRQGNYLVYFPSYQYLTEARELFQTRFPALHTLVQRPGMTDPERETFLAAFAHQPNETRVGFAVMGGIFGEGIDLVGDRLIGAVIVGVGLPQLCVERDLIRDYFEAKLCAGFDYAYQFPGLNRVFQAVGRVIRCESDRGAVLLIDTRFAETRYRRLFPKWWRFHTVRSPGVLVETLERFWQTP